VISLNVKKGNGGQMPQDIDQTLVIDDREAAQSRTSADEVLTVQQMAQLTGISAYTLRYYERAGLMQPVWRDATNGYRAYTRQHLGWIEFIKRLRATGMPIRDIQKYTSLILQGEQTVPERMNLLKQHRDQVEAHLLEVQQHLAAITKKVSYYEAYQADQQASVTCDKDSRLRNQGAMPEDEHENETSDS
jgi:DNA-binding transcriptional MerR regulator